MQKSLIKGPYICYKLLKKIIILNNSNKKERTASLDRIDSSFGYIEGNVQWVHKDINIIKLDYDQDYFIKICSAVCNYKNKENNSDS
jgi:hypothetical protein